MDYASALRELSDRALDRLPREPHLHAKRALGRHAFEDLLAAGDVSALGHLVDVYPDPLAVAAAVRGRAARLDPVAAHQALAVLTRIRIEQERHAAELPPRLVDHEPHTHPARDPFVEIGEEAAGAHAQLNAALIVAEVAASSAREADRLELARIAVLALEETARLDAVLAADGRHWGDAPVDLSAYATAMALDLPARLSWLGDQVAQLGGEGGGGCEDPAV